VSPTLIGTSLAATLPLAPAARIVPSGRPGGRREAPLSLQACPVTGAEERVLRHLPTNLSIPEIAARLSLSRHTVKSPLAASPPSGDAMGGTLG
jgi:hypothetical protein